MCALGHGEILDSPRIDIAPNATFVCGHPKSGTSLVASLLDSHPELVVYPEETLYFRHVSPNILGDVASPDILAAKQWLLRIFHWDSAGTHPSQMNYPGRDYSTIVHAEVSTEFDRVFTSLGARKSDLLPAAILAYGRVAGILGKQSHRWIEKSPFNEYFAAMIFSVWPLAKCVHVVRDPRDNYASYRLKHPEWTTEVFAHSWYRSTRTGWKNQKRYGESRYHIMHYEHLVSQPEHVMRRLSAFLEVEFHEELLKPSRAGQEWPGNSMFGDQFSSISQETVGRYATNLEPVSVQLLENLLLPEFSRLGYRTRKSGKL